MSRTAISKWESGKGYPNIDSLKEISKYFSVSIDDLLSGEKLLSIAEKENKSNIRNMCDLLFGIVDVCALMLIILPLYPKTIDGYIYSVNLFAYTETTSLNRCIYWIMFLFIIVFGMIKIIQTKSNTETNHKMITDISMGVHILVVLFLGITKEAYAIMVAFLLLVIKGLLVLRWVKIGN